MIIEFATQPANAFGGNQNPHHYLTNMLFNSNQLKKYSSLAINTNYWLYLSITISLFSWF